MNYVFGKFGRSFGVTLGAIVLAVSPIHGEPTHGTLVVAVNQEPQDLAAQGTYKEINAPGLRNVIETLIAVDPVSGDFVVPVLATAWERVDDRTLRFTIRDGVSFHDGDRNVCRGGCGFHQLGLELGERIYHPGICRAR